MTRELLHRAFVAGKAARLVHAPAFLNFLTIAGIMLLLVVLGSAG